MANTEEVKQALGKVLDPELRRSLIELGMVRDIKVGGVKVTVTLALTTLACPLKDRIVGDARAAILALPGVAEAEIDLVAMSAKEKMAALGGVGERERGAPLARQQNRIERVIAVMSGKGGVGKSLVTGLLAVSLAREGKKVGILDADVTGPSIPKMFGLKDRPGSTPYGIIPVRSRQGIAVMSVNLLLEREDEAVIWRGPLLAGAVKQFWEEVFWGRLDYLLVDLPPGTADVPLTVLQSLPVTGVVIVSSPQDLAAMVVRKAVRMARQMNIPILGAVENLSYFVCPDTGKRYEIFGPSRGEEMARAAEAPLLGRLPIDPEAASLCDAGRIEEYSSPAFEEMARAFAGLECRTIAADAAG